MKLIIHHGATKPFRAIGKNQCKLLDFAFRFPGWHSFRADKIPPEGKALAARGCLVINAFNQFRINMGDVNPIAAIIDRR